MIQFLLTPIFFKKCGQVFKVESIYKSNFADYIILYSVILLVPFMIPFSLFSVYPFQRSQPFFISVVIRPPLAFSIYIFSTFLAYLSPSILNLPYPVLSVHLSKCVYYIVHFFFSFLSLLFSGRPILAF